VPEHEVGVGEGEGEILSVSEGLGICMLGVDVGVEGSVMHEVQFTHPTGEHKGGAFASQHKMIPVILLKQCHIKHNKSREQSGKYHLLGLRKVGQQPPIFVPEKSLELHKRSL